MLYSYTLVFSQSKQPYWQEELKEGDSRSCEPWEICFPYQMDSQSLGDYANEEWCIPQVNGEEILHNFNGLKIKRSRTVCWRRWFNI